MDLLFGIIVGLVILVFLVVVHELGHAIVARRNGVVVEEFGIGFPPRAWSKKLKNGVLFTLNWLPLGGFVRMQGEHDEASKPGDYGAATFWQKTRILLAGVAVNWVVAALLLTVLAITGLPKILPNQFTIASDTSIVQKPVELTLVVDESPAAKAGLQTGDQIIRVNGLAIESSAALSDLTEREKGTNINVEYVRGGDARTAAVTLNADNVDNQGYLGVALGQRELIKATWSAPIVGVATTGQFTWATLQGIGGLLADLVKGLALQLSPNSDTRQVARDSLDRAGKSVAGPVGILGTIFPAAEKAGLTQLVLLSAVISLSLAVMNILPIPALDGGRWYTMVLFKLFRKPLTKSREEAIQTVGFLTLMALVVVITIADVNKLF
ncbi:MAG: M50 family metallopeptidase [Candidatus Saccharimonadales bacterium]